MHIHVLVVEDNFDLAGTVIDYLEAAGVVCDHARDGQAGLNLARANRYDVILLDIMLPRINGRQVCRQLREAGLQTPVLMLTALDTLQDKLDGFDAGADDYLLKPFERCAPAPRWSPASSWGAASGATNRRKATPSTCTCTTCAAPSTRGSPPL